MTGSKEKDEKVCRRVDLGRGPRSFGEAGPEGSGAQKHPHEKRDTACVSQGKNRLRRHGQRLRRFALGSQQPGEDLQLRYVYICRMWTIVPHRIALTDPLTGEEAK